ncbi:hypothetical protein LPB72_07265 [Hydrogenophaga crassostreae]|uniref:HTH cro/C1-type domain-containing protein n=1 Tax=Hydrogenophaga crassostreae TaxID=1763535 RepID=A0A163CJ72_9BURK|nr:hypothetical protein [Hydrogenophaga crassostreae]AOW13154.1 hypothetical protein LPB072_10105 [Hydrogenophaga crassostreae]OAD42700.1 hypothetical protein LPB72_07265 [Hydrogenophaga crassostreae]
MKTNFKNQNGCVQQHEQGALPKPEGKENRVSRLYAGRGGPLLAWLVDEARIRDIGMQNLARQLGVSYGYIAQLRSGHREVTHISQGFAEACGRFLGVPTIMVKVLAGAISIRDFAFPNEPEEVFVERAYRRMLLDPKAKEFFPRDPGMLSVEAKTALLRLYAESSGNDVFGWRELPEMVRWLQRATMVHIDSELAVLP